MQDLGLIVSWMLTKKKKNETPGSETKDFIFHSKSSSQSFIFVYINSPHPQVPQGQHPGAMTDSCLTGEERCTWGNQHCIVNESKPTLFQRETLLHPSRLLSANITLRDGPGGQGLAETLGVCGKLPLTIWTAKSLKIRYLGNARVSDYQRKQMMRKIFQ